MSTCQQQIMRWNPRATSSVSAMCSVRVALSSMARPWRPLCAYACCYLLPLSLALRPVTKAIFSSPAATATRSTRPSRFSRSSGSWRSIQTRRGGGSGSRSSSSSSSSSSNNSRIHMTSILNTSGAYWFGGSLSDRAAASCSSSQSLFQSNWAPCCGDSLEASPSRLERYGRGFASRSSGRGPSGRRRGMPLAMGKGSDRKKAKKSEVLEKGSGRRSPSGTGVSPHAARAELAVPLEDITEKEGFIDAIEHFRKLKAPKKVLHVFEAAKRKDAEGLGDLAAATVKANLKLSREDLARSVIDLFGSEKWDAWLANDLDGAQAVIRCACAASEPALAEEMIAKANFSCGAAEDLTGEFAAAAASVYPNLITAYSRKDRRGDAMRLLEAMAGARVPIKPDNANRLLQGFHKRRDLEAVFKVLDAMAAAGVDGNDETYEWLANAAVRGVDFVTGAVSMATLPKEPVLPEAAFIGRSNVGKSSLINMVCNRKALAFTSKRPGKTQQFNYFMMNNNTENAFYLVDMPGMGYARVPEKQRQEWSTLFRSYITRRSSLRVLFHLIDGRHGPVGQDHVIMKLMAELPDTARYVVVLTKADKSDNSVSKAVLESVISALRDGGVSRTPVLLTSATSKLGRDGMWRYLRLAALDKTMREQRVANIEGAAGSTRGAREVLDGGNVEVTRRGWRDGHGADRVAATIPVGEER